MGGYGTLGSGMGQITRRRTNIERTKDFTYHATDHSLLLDVETAQTVGSVKTSNPGDIQIINTGKIPAFAIVAYRLWSNATTMVAKTYHLNYLLKPGEQLLLPDSPVVISDETVEQLAGTEVTDSTPNSNMFADISTVSSGFDNTTDPVTIASADGDFWRVSDMVRCNAEVVEITAISGANLTVKRGMLGTSAASHSNGETLRLQFSNDYYDIDKFSTCRTDLSGKFKSSNLFGVGRAATGLQGITPGSFTMKFYTEGGYQSLGLSGITASSNSGLTASTEYGFDITVDGSGLLNSDVMKFTTDSDNLNWGGTNGVLQKINDVFTTQFYTTSSTIFGERVSVGIVNGDVVFRSLSNLTSTAILLAAPSEGETTPFGVGRFPAIGDVSSPVASFLPDDTIYDPITYAESPNESAFCYDNGNGVLFGTARGYIRYETGEIDFTGPASAEWVFSCLHTSAFSGKQNATDSAKMNTVKAIYGNLPNQKGLGQLTITRK